MADKNQCNNNQPVNESEINGLYVPTIQSLMFAIFAFCYTLIVCGALIDVACTNGGLFNNDPEIIELAILRFAFGGILFGALMMEIKEYKTNCYKLLITYLCAALLLVSTSLFLKGFNYLPFIFSVALPFSLLLNQKKYKVNGAVVLAVTVNVILLTIVLTFVIKKLGGAIVSTAVLTTLLVVIQTIVGCKIYKAYGGALKQLGKWMMIEAAALAVCIAAVSITGYAAIAAGVVMILIDFFFYRKFHKALCLCD